MSQKRFLTAIEVFQLFGVDADSLDQLVEKGEVTALRDQGNFKYRAEDFANLVKRGLLMPRTSGELFEVDSDGDMPFLKLQNDEQGVQFSEKMDFLELDENALEEQARSDSPAAKTPVIPENWFEDTEDSIDVPSTLTSSTQEIVKRMGAKNPSEEATDLEINTKKNIDRAPDSDSDVRLFGEDDEINFDGFVSSGSDSDVRLEGPVSSSGSARYRGSKNPTSESEIRLTTPIPGASGSDSDVTILSSFHEPSAHFNAPKSSQNLLSGKPGTPSPMESDIRIASPLFPASVRKSDRAKTPTDDSNVIVGSPTDKPSGVSAKKSVGKKPDSDSDVRLASKPVAGNMPPTPIADSHIQPQLKIGGDSGSPESDIRLEAAPDSPATPPPIPGQSSVLLSRMALDSMRESDSDVFDIPLDFDSASGIMLEAAPHVKDQLKSMSTDSESGVPLDLANSASDFVIGDEVVGTSGSEPQSVDSEFALLESPPAVPLSPAAAQNDSEIALEFVKKSGPSLPGLIGESSGIMLEADSPDSDLRLEESTEGVRFSSASESGIEINVDHKEVSFDEDEFDGIELDGIELDGPEVEIEDHSSHYSEESDSRKSEHSDHIDLDRVLEASSTESEIALEARLESGVSLEPRADNSGLDLDRIAADASNMPSSARMDSGISLEVGAELLDSYADSDGIGPSKEVADSGLQVEESFNGINLSAAGDSSIALGTDDSGISLDFDESGISLEASDSAINLSAMDSGIRLDNADSGISLGEGDSGISLDFEEDPNSTAFGGDVSGISFDPTQTDTLDMSGGRSNSEMNPADGAQTIEMDSHDGEESNASSVGVTAVYKGPKRKSSQKPLALSEAFNLDEPPEVQDLDISAELDSAGDEFSGDFADDDALEVSDDAFSESEVASDEDDGSVAPKKKSAAAIAKKKPVSLEPSWGLLATVPIICASLLMAVTMTAMLGGIATMWTGAEASGPIGMVISAIAGIY